MLAKNLSPQDRGTLLKLRQSCAEQGYEITPDDLIATLQQLNERFIECAGFTIFEARRILSEECPPPPPYLGWFDDEAEAIEFKQRAEEKHGVSLRLVKAGKKIKLKEVLA